MIEKLDRIVYNARWNYHHIATAISLDMMKRHVRKDRLFKMWTRVADWHLARQKSLTSNFRKRAGLV